jgi:hypothetical protein
VGHVLLQHFNGQAADLVRASGFSAVELVRLLSAFFPSFRDEALHQGEQVYFYKRAQILVADIWAAYGCRTDPPFPYAFRDMGELTMFADYRVPQVRGGGRERGREGGGEGGREGGKKGGRKEVREGGREVPTAFTARVLVGPMLHSPPPEIVAFLSSFR